MATSLLESAIGASINIIRPEGGLMKRSAAVILVDNRLVEFFPGDRKHYIVRPGRITVMVNKKKRLTFSMNAGEKIDLVVKEGIREPNFLIKYGILAALTFFILFSIISEMIQQQTPQWGYIFSLFFPYWIFWGIKDEYFYLQEA